MEQHLRLFTLRLNTEMRTNAQGNHSWVSKETNPLGWQCLMFLLDISPDLSVHILDLCKNMKIIPDWNHLKY
jgi:hypothetical protein